MLQEQKNKSEAWYRYPIVWLVWAIPLLAVVVSFVVLMIARG